MNISDSSFPTYAFYGALTVAAIAGCLGLLWLNELNMKRLERTQSEIEIMTSQVVDLLEQSTAQNNTEETTKELTEKTNKITEEK